MNRLRMVSVILMAVILISASIIGCGKSEDEGKVTITIGGLFDMSGPAKAGIAPIADVFLDTAKYYNDHNLIPGVTINALTYDTQYSPGRVTSGFQWLKDQGAQVIFSVVLMEAQILKPLCTEAGIPLVYASASQALLDDPGWSFCASVQEHWNGYTQLAWLEENDWDWQTRGPAKIGYVGYSQEVNVQRSDAMKEYAEAHPDKWTWVDSVLQPAASLNFLDAVNRLSECDYISSSGAPIGLFWKDYLAAGHDKAKFVDCGGSLSSVLAFATGTNGWEAYDGAISQMLVLGIQQREQSPLIDRLCDMLQAYRNSGEDFTGYENYITYASAGGSAVAVPFDILDRAVQADGADQFNSQAYYDAAVSYDTDSDLWNGYPVWSFSETKRYLPDDVVIYKIDAASRSFVCTGEWMPLLKEP